MFIYEAKTSIWVALFKVLENVVLSIEHIDHNYTLHQFNEDIVIEDGKELTDKLSILYNLAEVKD